MGGNYSNIDLANKMQHISKEGYLLHVSTITIHHLPKEHKLHQEWKKKKNLNQTLSIFPFTIMSFLFGFVDINANSRSAMPFLKHANILF